MKIEIKSAALAMALLASGMAQAAPPPSSDEAIHLPLESDLSAGVVGPALAVAPANDDLQREYPRVALLMDLGGHATITCLAMTDGRLDDCHVVEEDPVGMGFGAATVRAAAYFRVKPGMKDGKPVEGRITIPLRWQAGEGHTQPVAAPLVSATPAALALGRRVVALEDVAERTRAAWQPMMEQQTAQLMTEGDAQAGQAVMDAFRLGLNDAIQEEAERQAHELGAHMSEANLQATIAFLETPAGKAWLGAEHQSGAGSQKNVYQRLAVLARNHYCPQTGGCSGKAGATASR